MGAPSTRQELTDQRRDAFRMCEVDVVTALDLRRFEDLDFLEPCHHNFLGKWPTLQRANRQHRTLDGGKERQRLILSQPHSRSGPQTRIVGEADTTIDLFGTAFYQQSRRLGVQVRVSQSRFDGSIQIGEETGRRRYSAGLVFNG
jgi:hypothetical protein